MDENTEQVEEIEQETQATESTNTIINQIIAELGTNYNTSDLSVLETIYGNIVTIATTTANTDLTDELIPYIKTATKAEYLARGSEGLKSRGEGSISNTFLDIEEKLRADIVRGGLRRCY